MDTENVIIIGSGPAGYTAAIYASRANLSPLLFMGQQPGGQLMITSDVENYPGFPNGILGPELMDLFKKQAERFGTRIFMKQVTTVDFSQRPFKVVADGKDYYAKAVIVSTGASAKGIGLDSERRLMGHGVSACATCDGFFFKGKEVVVVGGGDTALEEATFLTRFCTKVTIVHRRNQLRASKIMQDKVNKNPKISFIWDSVVTDIFDVKQNRVTGVRLRNVKDGKESDLRCDGVFVAIGHEPNTSVFKGQVEMDEKGYIKTFGGTRTNVAGVFACGDVQDHVYRQAVTAAGSGCMAAIDAERYLESLH
ncbi:MAG: thioredoxin-disulfide reductase [Planctomycetes bacterium RBG_16_43_13]|nr:MAG: thioredoxin-disulfide reductase [Planctomycetes bacterium RBG_16_43_13]